VRLRFGWRSGPWSPDLQHAVRRITVAGEFPSGPDGFRSRRLEGELFGLLG